MKQFFLILLAWLLPLSLYASQKPLLDLVADLERINPNSELVLDEVYTLLYTNHLDGLYNEYHRKFEKKPIAVTPRTLHNVLEAIKKYGIIPRFYMLLDEIGPHTLVKWSLLRTHAEKALTCVSLPLYYGHECSDVKSNKAGDAMEYSTGTVINGMVHWKSVYPELNFEQSYNETIALLNAAMILHSTTGCQLLDAGISIEQIRKYIDIIESPVYALIKTNHSIDYHGYVLLEEAKICDFKRRNP